MSVGLSMYGSIFLCVSWSACVSVGLCVYVHFNFSTCNHVREAARRLLWVKKTFCRWVCILVQKDHMHDDQVELGCRLTYLGQIMTNGEAQFNAALRPQKP